MNDDLEKFEKKKCSSCNNYFYELHVELPKYKIFICKGCSEKNNNKTTDMFISMLKYGRINIKNQNKKY